MILTNEVPEYLNFCRHQKQLKEKTVSSYFIDLKQFTSYMQKYSATVDKARINGYIVKLHEKYKNKTVKRSSCFFLLP